MNKEIIISIPLSKLKAFKDHPFRVSEDAAMQQAVESVREYGVLVPAIARPLEDGTYELISGHRRKHACELAGLDTIPNIKAKRKTTINWQRPRVSSLPCSSSSL